MGGACSGCGRRGEMCTGSCLGKSEGKRQLEKPKRRSDDKINMDFQELGCGDRDWIELAQDKDTWRELVTPVMNLRVP